VWNRKWKLQEKYSQQECWKVKHNYLGFGILYFDRQYLKASLKDCWSLETAEIYRTCPWRAEQGLDAGLVADWHPFALATNDCGGDVWGVKRRHRVFEVMA
jgi:hypothetical protein